MISAANGLPSMHQPPWVTRPESNRRRMTPCSNTVGAAGLSLTRLEPPAAGLVCACEERPITILLCERPAPARSSRRSVRKQWTERSPRTRKPRLEVQDHVCVRAVGRRSLRCIRHGSGPAVGWRRGSGTRAPRASTPWPCGNVSTIPASESDVLHRELHARAADARPEGFRSGSDGVPYRNVLREPRPRAGLADDKASSRRVRDPAAVDAAIVVEHGRVPPHAKRPGSIAAR